MPRSMLGTAKRRSNTPTVELRDRMVVGRNCEGKKENGDDVRENCHFRGTRTESQSTGNDGANERNGAV